MLLKQIKEDEVSIISSRSTDWTGSSTTLREFGPASGKALMAVGSLAIRGVESIRLQFRLQSKLRNIGELVRREDDYIPAEYYEDLLELQRFGLYSKSIRFHAWDLLLLLMERRRTERLVDIIMKWPSIEIQLMLRQLSVFKLSGWSLHPARLVRIYDVQSAEASQALNLQRDSSCAQSYRNILGSVLRKNPRIIHEILGAEEYIFLQTPSLPGDDRTDVPSLSRLFDYLAREYPRKRPDKWQLPLAARDFVDFLASGPAEQCQHVVNYIASHLRPVGIHTSFPKDIHAVIETHRNTGYRTSMHSAFALLWFTIHLALRSRMAFGMLLEADLLDIMRSIWTCGLLEADEDEDESTQTIREDMRTACCILLGVISSHRVFPNLASYLALEHTTWFLAIFSHFMDAYTTVDAVRLPACSEPPRDDRSDFYHELLNIVGVNDAHAGTPLNDEQEIAWKVLIHELDQRRETHVSSALLEFPSDHQKSMILRRLVDIRVNPRSIGLDHSEARARALQVIVKHISAEEPILSHQSIDVRIFAFILTNSAEVPVDLKKAFDIFFDLYSPEEPVQYTSLKLPRHVGYYIEYLRHVPREQILVVADYLTSVLLSYSNSDTPSESEEVHQMRLPQVLQILHLASYLSFQSDVASSTLLKCGVMDILSGLWTQTPSSILIYGHGGNFSMARNVLRMQCLLLLGALAQHSHDDILDIIKADPRRHCLTKTKHLDVLSSQLCIHVDDVGWYDVTTPLRSLLSSLGFSLPSLFQLANERPFLVHPWEHILDPFIDLKALDHQKVCASEEILKLCTFAPQESWWAVIQAGFNIQYRTQAVFKYMIREYLGCEDDHPWAIPPASRSALLSLSKTSEKYGFTTVNPVDRLMLFISATCIGTNASSFRVLENIGVEKLMDELLDGSFDFCGNPNDGQRMARAKECKWLRGYMLTLSAYEFGD
ncbi:unnamed protein product [Somion occarium]